MAVAAANRLGNVVTEASDWLVLAFPEQPADERIRQRAEVFIGAVAMEGYRMSEDDTVETEDALTYKPIESLYDALRAVEDGDPRGRKMIEVNAFTDVIERTIKSGHIMEIDMMVDEAGVIQQHGQCLDSVQANSLRYASANRQMRARVEAETRNSFRLKHAYEEGLLEDYYYVVLSRAADDMSQSAMRDAGFFTDTMSCAIQATSAKGDRLVTESAFVAGTVQPGATRHDQATLVELGARLGIELANKTATELLDTPLLIHKSLMQDGVVNLVQMYDAAAGGSFFGEDKPQQDYHEYRRKCAEREQRFQPKVDEIVQQLIDEAATITSPAMAVERLNKISGKHMIELASEDISINPEVFGAPAAARIEMARWYIEQGDVDRAQDEIREAIKVDRSNSCPSGRRNSPDDQDSKEGSNEDESGDCDFISKECPLCHEKNVKTTVRKVGNKKRISGDCTKKCSIVV